MGQSTMQPFSHATPCERRDGAIAREGANIRPFPKSSGSDEYTDHHSSKAKIVIAQTSADRVDHIKSLKVKVAPRNELVVLEILRSTPGHGITAPQQRAESYAACVHLTALDSCDVWRDNKHMSLRGVPAGTVHISDMRHKWRADVQSQFHVVNFYIPQGALDEIAKEQGSPPINDLQCPIDVAHVDAVFSNLTLALLPALVHPDQTSRLFTDFAARAVIVHLAKSYGSLRIKVKFGDGGLAPWQERRAKDLLLAHLSGDLSLPDLANACRLSTGHFSRAFRRTFGCPPHQWLLMERVEKAKQLMLNSSQPLSEIALATGFADQSHFTRVFTQRAKTSPAAWRRAHAEE